MTQSHTPARSTIGLQWRILQVVVATLLLAPLVAAQADGIKDAIQQAPPAVDVTTGSEIPSKGYCDQPYVIQLDDGTWLCTMTTGKGHEGQRGQHIVATRSNDRGKTWSPLVAIEPADGPEASWAMPYLTKYGRVYVFYTYNAENLRRVKGGGKRVDTLGKYALKYSDDGGRTWSERRWFIPVRETAIDRENPYGGEVRFFWGVGKPIRHKGAMYLGFTKVGAFGRGFIAKSESFFLRCENIDTERDPAKLKWRTLPDGDRGLVSPEGPIASEVNLTGLSDGSLYCTYRTIAGHPCHAYSRDNGKTWTEPAFMTNRPGGALVNNPRAANFVRKLTEGPYAGRYIYWFHNHSGTGYLGRNPAYLLGGIEHDGPEGKVIHWGDPLAVLYHRNAKVRMSYPDFIWDDGLYITQTQKSIARVNRIPDPLLERLWVDVPEPLEALVSAELNSVETDQPGGRWTLPLVNEGYAEPVRVSVEPLPEMGRGWRLRIKPPRGEIAPGERLTVDIHAELQPEQARYPLPEVRLRVEAPLQGQDKPVRLQRVKALPLVGGRPKLSILPAAEPPKVDGRLDEPLWDRPAQTPALGRMDRQRRDLAPTSVRFAADDRTLYVAFRCEEPKADELRLKARRRDEPAYKDDSVELMLDPTGQGETYFHFVANAEGVLYDAERFDKSFNAPGVRSEGRIDGAGYSVELAVPWKSLKLKSRPERLELLVARTRHTRGSAEVFQFPISPQGNHQPDFFARATLVEDEPAEDDSK